MYPPIPNGARYFVVSHRITSASKQLWSTLYWLRMHVALLCVHRQLSFALPRDPISHRAVLAAIASTRPAQYPASAPYDEEMGQGCHGRSQSRGTANAPTHAPASGDMNTISSSSSCGWVWGRVCDRKR